MPIERRNWEAALNPQERRELRELERKIRDQVEGRKGMRLVYLKHKRQLIQNRVTTRARRSLEMVG